MTDPTTDELADKLASLRRKMVAAATDQTTPEQRAEWKAADEAMAQRIRKARPGILPHHALATLETLRAIQRYDAGAEPMTDERAAELLAPLEAKARALHAQKDAEHRAVVLREAADVAESLCQFEHATGARWSAQVSENVGILRVADELRRLADAASGPGGAAGETRQDERPRCPHCQMPHELEPGSMPAVVCASIRQRIVEAERLHAEGDHRLCCRADCDVLRQREGETQQDETQAPYPPTVEWHIETKRRGDLWVSWSCVRYELAEAQSAFAETVKHDGGRHAWRLIRETTTYAVEAEQPAAVSQPGKDETP